MWIFIGRNVEARASQAGLHKPKKDTASAKEGKVSSLCIGGRRLKAVLLIRRKTWPRATENIVQVAQSGRHDFTVKKLEFITCKNVARSVASRPKKDAPLAKKLLRSRLFCVPQSVKTKETYPTRPGSPTPCKQAL